MNTHNTSDSYLGLGRPIQPPPKAIFFSLHSDIERDFMPVASLTGSAGSGKSFAAAKLTRQMIAQGTSALCINPNNDPIYTDMASTVINLGQEHDGMLDPFSLGLIYQERVELVAEIVGDLIGKTSPEERLVLNSAVSEALQEATPSLDGLTDNLLSCSSSDAEIELGLRLDEVRTEDSFAGLIFIPMGNSSIQLEKGLTVINLPGLDLPSSSTQASEYSVANRVALVVMSLLAGLTSDIITHPVSPWEPKAIIIEEAWAALSTSTGKDALEKIARVSRSVNTAVILVSLPNSDWYSSSPYVRTRLAFRESTKSQAQEILRVLGCSDSDPESIRTLKNGECLFKAGSGEVSQVEISESDEA